MTARLLSVPMLRVLPVLALCACGGFHTPGQEVSVGLALSSVVLPPQASSGGHTMVLNQAHVSVTATATATNASQAVEVGAMGTAVVELTSRWSELASGPLPHGDYQRVHLDVGALTLDGTWDGAPFHLESTESKGVDLALLKEWRVELGKASAVSVVTDPARWMTHDDGQLVELIDPSTPNAAAKLTDRFFDSLTAARDDDRNGVPDADHP